MCKKMKESMVTEEPNEVVVTNILPSNKTQCHTICRETETSEDLSCGICMENIKETEKIWVCTLCRNALHFECVQTWCYSNMGACIPGAWHCPRCRHVIRTFPVGSYCFCGQTSNLATIPTEQRPINHSCRRLCNRLCFGSRGDHCQHPCTLGCHKGLCPRCEEPSTFSCWCDKITKQVKCFEMAKLNYYKKSCNRVCGRTLNCGKHRCEKICHPLRCEPCTEVISRYSCCCGRKTYKIYCGQAKKPHEKTCDGVCIKVLSCGIHRCKYFCHTGDCESSPPDPTSCESCLSGNTSKEEFRTIRNCCDQR